MLLQLFIAVMIHGFPSSAQIPDWIQAIAVLGALGVGMRALDTWKSQVRLSHALNAAPSIRREASALINEIKSIRISPTPQNVSSTMRRFAALSAKVGDDDVLLVSGSDYQHREELKHRMQESWAPLMEAMRDRLQESIQRCESEQQTAESALDTNVGAVIQRILDIGRQIAGSMNMMIHEISVTATYGDPWTAEMHYTEGVVVNKWILEYARRMVNRHALSEDLIQRAKQIDVNIDECERDLHHLLNYSTIMSNYS